jgi:purine-cytosine permease-like protein
VVCTFENEQQPKSKKPSTSQNPWKTFAVFSGATLQLAVSVVVFGYLGVHFGQQTHHAWLSVVGVILGVVVGGSGLAFLAKQILGDKP